MGFNARMFNAATDTLSNEANRVETIRQARAREDQNQQRIDISQEGEDINQQKADVYQQDADTRNQAVFAAAHTAVNKSAQNLQSIALARQRLDQQQQALDLNKQKGEVQLKQMELQGGKTQMETDMLHAQLDAWTKQQQAVLDGHTAMIDQAEHQQAQTGRQAGQVASQLFQDPSVQAYATGQSQPQTVVPGPQGGMVAGQDESADTTPPAVGSLFGDLPQVGDTQPALTASGRIGTTKTTQADVDAMKVKKIEDARDQGIPLSDDEQAFYNKKMGVKSDQTYNRQHVLRLARTMALDNVKSQDATKRGITQADLDSFIPTAEKELYGKTSQPQGTVTDVNEGTAKALGNLEQTGYKPTVSPQNAPVKVIAPNGNMVTIPFKNLAEALKRGARRVSQ